MKELPDNKTLLELLELAKEAEQKTKEAGELIEAFAQKWSTRDRASNVYAFADFLGRNDPKIHL